MKLPQIADLEIKNKRVFVRADLDVPFERDKEGNFVLLDDSRLRSCLPTFQKVLELEAKRLLIAGHIGLHKGEDREVSTELILPRLEELLGEKITFISDVDSTIPETSERVVLLENLRKFEGEEENTEEFAKKLSALADIYINEAFATSHRSHASIVGIPKFLPHAAGLRFSKEIDVLSEILRDPKKPVVAVISGIKEDKLTYAKNLLEIADKVLMGGRLPEYLEKKPDPEIEAVGDKIVVAALNPDKEDITIHSIEAFESEIKKAGTIILAGVVGKYEDEGQRLGTKRVFGAIANSTAYKLVGGGDSEAAITLFGLHDKFDWISVGGGACLDYLTKGTLPGLEALKD